MLKSILKALLLEAIDRLDRGNCNLTQLLEEEIIRLIGNFNPEMSKSSAYLYLGLSRATFDNYVHDGLIPHGIKRDGFNELFWNKYDLDSFLLKQSQLE